MVLIVDQNGPHFDDREDVWGSQAPNVLKIGGIVHQHLHSGPYSPDPQISLLACQERQGEHTVA